MTRIWGRRVWLLGLTVAVALVATGCVGFTGTKVVIGDRPDGAFVVRITCQEGEDDPQIRFLVFEEGDDEQSTGGFLGLDNFVFESGDATCTVTEIEDLDADIVTYECGDFESGPAPLTVEGGAGTGEGTGTAEDLGVGGPGMSRNGPPPPPEPDVMCTETPDGLEYVITGAEDSSVDITFTVTNEFLPAPTTTAPPAAAPEAAPAPAPAPPVAAQPTFTG